MKYKTIISLLTALLLISWTCRIRAQDYKYVPFPDSNAVWSEIHWKPIFDPPPRWVYNRYALFNEDTVINGIVYHKLFHTHDSKITRENSKCIGGIREDSMKSVWLYNFDFPDDDWKPPLLDNQNEIKLYDFSMSIGDTIKNINFLLPYEFLIVKQVDSIQIYNTIRKVYSFHPIYWTHWIEGIGNVKGLLFPSGDLPTNGMNNDLICMHQNDTLLYYYPGTDEIPYDDCVPSFVINGVPLLANTDVKIYPNPVTTGIVYFENLDFETLQLFDLNGNLIQEEDIQGLNAFELKIPGLPPGTYTYRLKTKGLVPTQGKLVVR